MSVIITVKCLTKNLIGNWRYKILSQIFTITYHDHISYVVLFKLRLVKMLSGNNYTILHAMPPIVDDAKKYAVILSDVVINM